jgi:trimeric autotransporter adhesin
MRCTRTVATRAGNRRRRLPAWALLPLVACLPLGQTQAAPSEAGAPAGWEVRGAIRCAGVALPGVAVTLALDGQTETIATATALDGSYTFRVPGPGRYTLGASLMGFASVSRSVELAAEGPRSVVVEIEMGLRSRTPESAAATPGPPASSRAAAALEGAPRPQGPQGPPSRRARGEGAAAGPGRGRFRGVDVLTDAAGEAAGDAADTAAEALLPPGFSADAPTESVALTGNGRQVQTIDALLFRDRLQWLEESGGDLDALARRIAQSGEGPGGGQRGFPGEGPGGFGGGGFGGGGFGGGPGGGPGGGFRGGGFGRSDRIQGSVFYGAAGSPFDARPYSLNGQPTQKPEYFQNRFGATLGGPLKIPGIYDGTSRTSFNLSYSGARTHNPYDAYSTVPTEAEREGDLSGLDATVYDPTTGEPFPDNVIPAGRISPTARALLAFYPLPNQPGAAQNYHHVTATSSSSDQVTLRLSQALGGGGGEPGAPARGPLGRGGRGSRRPGITAAVTYRRSSTEDTPTFPTVGGTTRSSSWDVPVSLSLPTGGVFHQLRFDYNRNESRGQNLFAGTRDVAGEAGVLGASSDPADWGVPNLSFTGLSALRDRNPSYRLDQRISIGDVATLSWGKHNIRFGGGFRSQRLESETDSNPRGSFVFTGLYTTAAADGAQVPGTGSDFADFLLGKAQQASVQYGPGRVRFSGSAWNLFLQDDWRLRPGLTLNVGLRYEYVSPFVEAHDHLVNLDVTPDFSAAAPVTAGESGAYSGAFPRSLVSSDWNNLAPRIGLAWKPTPASTVRGGFGINYSLGAYSGIAQHLAAQPPYAETKTLLGSRESALTLEDGLTQPGAPTNNSFGIDKNYALPAVWIWNLDVQRRLGDLVVDIGYTGTRGYDLDLERVPNRGPDGLRIPGVAPFVWESSGATSIMHSGTLRVRKRMTHGFGGGVSYTYGKSIDDASSIGGGAVVVAQNDQDLAAERGLSSFDRRHILTGDWLLELPIGPGRKWLREGALASVIGGWVWGGSATLQSGTPFTARVVGNFGDVARGVNGTLRADVTGASVEVADPSVARWFDTDAFTPPPSGSFGDAGRNTVIGPTTFLVNMSLIKNIDLGRPRTLSIRVQANNVFNTPPFVGIDTVVSSPTYGRVVQVGPMRSVQLQTRLRF